MSCNFMSLFTILSVISDPGRVTVKGCVQWNPILQLKDLGGWMNDLLYYILFNSISVNSYQDDSWMIKKGCVQWNLDYH